MLALKSLAVGTAAVAFFAIGVPNAHAAGTVRYAAASSANGESSSDWSGWDVTGDTYTSVSASWTVPSVTCAASETSYSAYWVGLDGDGSSSVEQIGTSSDCDSGTPSYSAWYEFYPEDSVSLPNDVKAGDKIKASVQAVSGSDEYKLVLTDTTQGWTKTQNGESPSGTGASAEIIAEAPSGSSNGNSVLPLADFKTATFSDVLVDGQKIGGVTSARKIAMIDSNGSSMATVSDLDGDDAFTVTWVSSGADDTTGQGSAGSGWTQTTGDGWGQTGSGSTGSGSTGTGDTGSGSTGTGDTGSGSTGTGDTGSGSGLGDTGAGSGLGANGWGDTGWGNSGLGDSGWGNTGLGDSGWGDSTGGYGDSSDPYSYGYGDSGFSSADVQNGLGLTASLWQS